MTKNDFKVGDMVRSASSASGRIGEVRQGPNGLYVFFDKGHENLNYSSPLDPERDTLVNPAAVALGKLGGSRVSEKKRKAAQANGKKGGRPKKKVIIAPPQGIED